jgi:hypothetical protein
MGRFDLFAQGPGFGPSDELYIDLQEHINGESFFQQDNLFQSQKWIS